MRTREKIHSGTERNWLPSKSSHKHRRKGNAYELAYGFTAQKCRFAYERAYEPGQKRLRQCLHYYIGTIGNTLVGTLKGLQGKLQRLRRHKGFLHFLFVCKGERVC